MTREDLDRLKALGQKTTPIFSAEARDAIKLLTAEIERTWKRIPELIEANNKEVERRRAVEAVHGLDRAQPGNRDADSEPGKCPKKPPRFRASCAPSARQSVSVSPFGLDSTQLVQFRLHWVARQLAELL